MRVALVTTWNERCGIAEYAKNLIDHSLDVDYKIIDRPFTPDSIITRSQDCDIVHINYEPGLFQALPSYFGHSCNKPTVLTLHTSHNGNNRTPFTDYFTKVVVHERTLDDFYYIPHGINVCKLRPVDSIDPKPRRIGTFGFPFPWKGFAEVVQAARLIGRSSTVVSAESPHWDVHKVAAYLQMLDPLVQVITQYYTQSEVVQILHRCDVNVFAYQGGNSGISGAVRQGLAARRPIVLSRCRQFRDLFEYYDEITFIENTDPESIAEGIEKALANPLKIPHKVLEDMSWSKTAKMYSDLYKSL